MILASLPLTTLFRVLTPRWAFQPLSGAGAAKQGGRFNRPGQQASSPAKGLIFPSIADPGGFNLVVYLDRLDGADLLEVHDPEGALPRNQDSWL
jgi:RES domain-containing protein